MQKNQAAANPKDKTLARIRKNLHAIREGDYFNPLEDYFEGLTDIVIADMRLKLNRLHMLASTSDMWEESLNRDERKELTDLVLMLEDTIEACAEMFDIMDIEESDFDEE